MVQFHPESSNCWTVPNSSGTLWPRYIGGPERPKPSLALQDSMRRQGLKSGEDILDDVAVDIGEAEVSPRVTIRQAGMVESKQVQDGGVKIVDVHLVRD